MIVVATKLDQIQLWANKGEYVARPTIPTTFVVPPKATCVEVSIWLATGIVLRVAIPTVGKWMVGKMER